MVGAPSRNRQSGVSAAAGGGEGGEGGGRRGGDACTLSITLLICINSRVVRCGEWIRGVLVKCHDSVGVAAW